MSIQTDPEAVEQMRAMRPKIAPLQYVANFSRLVQPWCDSKGQVIRWYVARTDIEDRKQAEERLQRENMALRCAVT